jgi:hypothetical protein
MTFNLLQELLNLRNKIINDGWIVIPPQLNDNEIAIRVEWFIAGEKHGFEKKYTADMLESSNGNFIERFTDEANHNISRLLKDRTASSKLIS